MGLWLPMMMEMDQQCPNGPIFKISAFYIEFKGEKNPHILEVLVGIVGDSGGS